MKIQSVAVIGAGQMGSGIAALAASQGMSVIVMDQQISQLEKAKRVIEDRWKRNEEKGYITAEERSHWSAQLQYTHQLEQLDRVDLVIEAIIEQRKQKQALFQTLDRFAADHTILASNTSSLSITELAAHTSRATKVIGMHFMNPVHRMPLVEVVQGLETNEEVVQTIVKLARDWGKEPVVVQDAPGFISNRLLMPMLNEAVFALQEGIASAEEIDQIMRLGMNHPMGPLALADLIGLDTCLYIMESLYQGFGDDKYRPCPLLRKYVQAGRLGKKSGRGFYLYSVEE
ncbi:3-hydroxyacyl-CoA dehydrogenase [Seinonella peptonophila]|uniref:3-hydroxyacyl-CoA dehydrogenase n=1 Tax=Seinonella peptonophila TaxID=112248 RepID=A0A1M4XWR9_9BACL|nr:3-hydroxyacyl-CoA dehydrogenase NAD-binding domain-containing protein [Seinonella peptonophila]SHE97931.1 3-hydroxyacyl-CoA dehydrogenase [Seinonella peptonophila]